MTDKLSPIVDFLGRETTAGMLLIVAAALAMLLANSPWAAHYQMLIDLPFSIGLGDLFLSKPLLLWVNDGLMAVFFFLVGLELKREVLTGELSSIKSVSLPAFGALGGMLIPAIIYSLFNWTNTAAMQGWAIPVATDIAFALAVLLLLGPRIPASLKIFLVSLAIFDDIGAILIIAFFYTGSLSVQALMVSLSCIIVLLVCNLLQVSRISVYIFIGVIMWLAVLKSGVHATLAGVILALFIPLRHPRQADRSPLQEIEHSLHSVVSLAILPLFAFANAGISLAGIDTDYVLHPIPMGIVAGLLVGKPLGVFSFCWLATRLRLATLPGDINWAQLFGVALLCGIGFTMSLFISSLAFEETGVNLLFDERLGIIFGSLCSAIAGYVFLRRNL